MKKTLLTIALVASCTAAFAQGKVSLANDANHYFVIGTAADGDAAFGGGTSTGIAGAITGVVLPSGASLVAGLYAGADAGSLTLRAPTAGPTAIPLVDGVTGEKFLAQGLMSSVSYAITGIAGGATGTFQVAIWDGRYASYALSEAAGSYFGLSPVFTAITGSSISYPSLLPGGPTASTWVNGNIVINANPIPEPGTFALAGLGAAALLIFRRRK